MAITLPPADEYDDVRLLPIPAAARLLAVSERTLYRMIRAGELRTIPVWGKARVPLTELRRYVERQSAPLLVPRSIRRR